MDDRDGRPDPDALLRDAAREHRGRLRVFLGAAPGVGKTWAMLDAGRRRQAEGGDVLVGLVETHGRAETQAQLVGLRVMPRRTVAYRGQVLEEFDVEAALASHPPLLLIDELAHTNAPGSRHHKRWEDVADLLDAGIDVWSTLNVQHLESLNDAVARITGVRVTETLPDSVLELADEIELIDLPPGDLRARLKEGRIYRPDVARRALEGFFREGNLAALRDIALRQAAHHVDQNVRDYMRRNAIIGPWPAGDRVLALVGGAGGEAVVRAAKQLADALKVPLVALHVETPGGDDGRALLDLAATLGAQTELRAGTDATAVATAYTAQINATHLVIGRAPPSRWRPWPAGGMAARLLLAAPSVTLHVVAAPPRTGRGGARAVAPPRPGGLHPAMPWLLTAALVGLVVLSGEMLSGVLEQQGLGMLFLGAVVASAAAFGLRLALFAAALGFLSWNYFFIEPIYSITIASPRDVVALVVFAGVALATGALASRMRAAVRTAQGRIEGLRRISHFSRALGEPAHEHDLFAVMARQAAEIAGAALVLTARGEDIDIRAAEPPMDTMDDRGWAAARWCLVRGEPAGRGTSTLPSSPWRFLPVRTARGTLAVLGVNADALAEPQQQALTALADQAAVALERVRLAAEAARAEAMAETQKLRTALLSSLSHDLRTPLTSIRGAAGLLRTADAQLSADKRADLLASIEHDTVRMARFLSNILAMTQLESGQIVPREQDTRLVEVIEAAVARVGGAALVTMDFPDDLPAVRADPQLLEQLMVNVIENAVKYSPDGAPVRIGAHAARGRVLLSVADEGVGITPADLPHVFDSFYRARRTDRTTPGTGLGLAIARGLVEAMGGRITAASPRPDAPRDGAPGTVITIDLPTAAPASRAHAR